MVSEPARSKDDEAGLLHGGRNGADAMDVVFFINFELRRVFFCFAADPFQWSSRFCLSA
jgi:hypothetical protein